MNSGKRSAAGAISPAGNPKKNRKMKWICILLLCITILFNAVSLFFLPKTMGVPISGMEHLNRMSSALFLGSFTIMQGLLCCKGIMSGRIRCPIAGILLFALDAALVILNIMYPG